MSPAGPDPFGTAQLRHAALTTWRTDPSRLRQDANLEEDHARGYYRDRVVVELAQNAADAASATGTPGRLLLQLRATELLAANTGAPLTPAGVAALASMRASVKTEEPVVGRFGVGFAAVRSVGDEVTVASRGDDGAVAGVLFSLDRTSTLLTEQAHESEALAAVVHRRDGELPALRLPFPAPHAEVPAGYDTAVRITLRGDAEVAAVRAALAQVDDVLLLALPALGEVVVDDDGERRTVRDVARRWRTVHTAGDVPGPLLADRPVEERGRRRWAVTWALPTDGTLDGDQVLHAPTPTEEPTTLPALLVATFPLDPTRRHVATGRLTEYLVQQSGAAYAELAEQLARAGADPLRLVPIGLPAGPLDAALHAAAVEHLRGAALLREDGTGELAPARATHALRPPLGEDPAVVTALAAFLPGLVTVPAGRQTQARLLGVELRDPGDVVESLPLTASPSRWQELYAALAPHAATHREALAALPVPLADGRTVRGARGVLLPRGEVPEGLPGVRLVHPDAAHPLLALLGAREAGAVELLDQPEVRQAALDGEDDHTVLALAAWAVTEHEDVRLPAWVGQILLPARDGELLPAAELVLPGTWAAEVFDAPELDPRVAERWPESTWRAVGVRTGLTVRRMRDVVAEPAQEEPVEGWADYLAYLADELGPGAYVEETTAVSDLDVVTEKAWPAVLRRMVEDPAPREALLTPVHAVSGPRPAATAASYTAWWLREELGAPFMHPDASGAAVAFLPPAPTVVAGCDDAVLAALGAVRDLADLDAAGWDAYADRWPPEGPIGMPQALALWRGIAGAARRGVPLPAADALPALVDGRAVMQPAEEVVVGPPMWAQVSPVLPVPAGDVAVVAEALDVDAVVDRHARAVGAQRVAVPAPVAALVPEAPGEYWECDALTVEGTEVEWWVGDGEVLTTTVAGLARGLAHAAGRWSLRWALESALTDPVTRDEVIAEMAGDSAE